MFHHKSAVLPHPRTLRWPKRLLNRTVRTYIGGVVTVRLIGITPMILITPHIYSLLHTQFGPVEH